MNNEDLSILKACYQLMQKIENKNQDPLDSEEDLFKLSVLLKNLENSEALELQKLSHIPDHFYPHMPLKFFLTWIIPVERALGRQLSDDQFLVLKDDRQNISPALGKVPLYFILENLRSSFNVGSLFRLADCVGAEHIYLTGYTATPLENESLRKTSLGADQSQAWSHQGKIISVIQELKAKNVQICALETAQNAKNLHQVDFKNQKTAFVVGNERFGLEASTLALCDQVISIPTFGVKNSLNVANALSIAAYEWRRQWK
jgi:tRNA G18 (ribose-2'-O)-methylase SpoU